MKDLRQISLGILAALLSAGLVMGSFYLALTESVARVASLATQIQGETVTTPFISGLPTPITVSPTETSDQTVPETATLGISPTVAASPTPQCQLPDGWMTIIVQPGDTLASLAKKFNITEEALMDANCMIVASLIPGTELYVPEQFVLPTSPSILYCGPPAGWVSYTIQPGDNLFRLSRELGVTITELQFANCMGSSILIRAGDILYVPFLPYRPTAVPTRVPTEAPTPVPTPVPTVIPTPVPTEEPTSLPTVEPTEEPTIEPTEEPTVEPTEEPTPPPTEEPTEEPTVEPTEEPTVEPTEEPTVEPTIEPTVEPTEEPTPPPTEEPTEEPTVEPTEEPTVEPTEEPTVEPTVEPPP